MAGAVYVYYTEMKPVVIFGLRIYERDFPLSSALAEALAHQEESGKRECRAG